MDYSGRRQEKNGSNLTQAIMKDTGRVIYVADGWEKTKYSWIISRAGQGIQNFVSPSVTSTPSVTPVTKKKDQKI